MSTSLGAHAKPSQEAPVREQRVGARIAYDVEVELRMAGSSIPLMGTTRNLGAGGVCIRTSFRFAMADLCEIRIVVDGQSLAIPVEARWQREDPIEDAMLTGTSVAGAPSEVCRRLWQIVQRRSIELSRFLHERCRIRGMQHSDARDLGLFTSLRRVQTGHRVYTQGDTSPRASSLFVVQQGQVVLDARVHHNHEVWLDRVEEGGLFGGLALVAGTPPIESAIADTEVTLLEIDSFSFQYLARARPQMARLVAKTIRSNHAEMLRKMIERVAALA